LSHHEGKRGGRQNDSHPRVQQKEKKGRRKNEVGCCTHRIPVRQSEKRKLKVLAKQLSVMTEKKKGKNGEPGATRLPNVHSEPRAGEKRERGLSQLHRTTFLKGRRGAETSLVIPGSMTAETEREEEAVMDKPCSCMLC